MRRGAGTRLVELGSTVCLDKFYRLKKKGNNMTSINIEEFEKTFTRPRYVVFKAQELQASHAHSKGALLADWASQEDKVKHSYLPVRLEWVDRYEYILATLDELERIEDKVSSLRIYRM